MVNLLWLMLSMGFIKNVNEPTRVAPVIIQGVIINEDKQAINKAHVYTVYGEEETFTNDKGEFKLETRRNLPVKLTIQYDGYKEKIIEITHDEKALNVLLVRGSRERD